MTTLVDPLALFFPCFLPFGIRPRFLSILGSLLGPRMIQKSIKKVTKMRHKIAVDFRLVFLSFFFVSRLSEPQKHQFYLSKTKVFANPLFLPFSVFELENDSILDQKNDLKITKNQARERAWKSSIFWSRKRSENEFILVPFWPL